MLWQISRVVIRSGWWLLIIVFIVIALYLSLGRLAVYSIASNQQQVERLLRNNGLEFVDIGTIEGGWHVHDPKLGIHNLVLRSGEEAALEMDYLGLRIDSIRSLIAGMPIIREIEVAGLRFTLARDKDKFWIRGLPPGSGLFNWEYILDSIPHLQAMKLTGVDVDLAWPGQSLKMVSKPEEPWLIIADGDAKRLSIPVYVREGSGEEAQEAQAAQEGSLNFAGTYQGDVRREDFTADLYLNAAHIGVESFLPEMTFAGRPLSAILATRAWLKLTSGKVDLTGELTVSDARLGGEQRLLESLESRFRFQGEHFTEGQLSIPTLHLKDGDFEFELPDLTLAITAGAGKVVAGRVRDLDIGKLVGLVEFAESKSLLAEGPGRVLSAFNVRGLLKDVVFVANLDGGDPRLIGAISDLSLDAYLGVPAVDRLNGLVSLGPERGYLSFANEQFELNFASIFAEAWSLDSGRGRISYEVAEEGIHVSSGLIELIRGDLAAYGKFTLKLPAVRESHTWGLTIGITEVEFLDARQFIPKILSKKLVDWLEEGIQEGKSLESGLTFHGSLVRHTPKIQKSHDLYFKAEDARLRYHPEWPELSGLAGTIHVNNYFVGSEDMIGRVYDSRIISANMLAPLSLEGRADTIKVEADVQGPVADVLRTLNETPLAVSTKGVATEWSAEGSMMADVRLDVPIGARIGEEVDVLVNLDINAARLTMPKFNLRADELNGIMTYDTGDGLTSDGLTGIVFDQLVQAVIKTETHNGSGEIILSMNGALAAEDLYGWTGQTLLSRAHGQFDYRTSVHIPYRRPAGEPYVKAWSNLVGATMNLPYPLDKTNGGAAREFNYRQVFKESGHLVDMRLDDHIHASLKLEEGIAVGGRIHVGTDAAMEDVTYDGIKVTGELDRLDFTEWLRTTEDLSQLSEALIEDAIAGHVKRVSMKIDDLTLFDLSLQQVDALVIREEDTWKTHISSDLLDGDLHVYDDSRPAVITLTRLNLDTIEDEGEGEGEGEDAGMGDMLDDINPLALFDVDFRANQLQLGGEDYGDWSFEYRVGENEARFENLVATTNFGLNILPGSHLQWNYHGEEQSSLFAGELLIDDLAQMLERFSFASSIEAEGLKISTEVGWQGSPARVGVNKLEGIVSIKEGKGKFVQAETGGALKLLGIFDFASLARRFRLDFSDILSKGFEFNDISGVTAFKGGVIDVKEPIIIDGSTGRLKVGGSVDLNTGALDNDMIVTLPVEKSLPWYAAYSAIVTNPLAGAWVMIAKKVFKKQIDQMSSAKYKVSGTIEQPRIEFVTIFNDKVKVE